MSPVAFSLFGIDLYWYGFLYLLGFLLSDYYIRYIIKNAQVSLTNKDIENLFFYIMLGTIAGARIGYFLFYEEVTIFTFDVLMFRYGGMSFHGGLLGILFASVLFSKIYNKNFFMITDLITICAPIGLFFGRIANHINNEIPGKILFGIQHPVVLYEAFFEGIILFILLNLKYIKNIKAQGLVTALFLILYSIFRFLLDFLKDQPKTFLNLQTGQLLCLPMLIFGLCLLNYKRKI